jgi:hypothetical protein
MQIWSQYSVQYHGVREGKYFEYYDNCPAILTLWVLDFSSTRAYNHIIIPNMTGTTPMTLRNTERLRHKQKKPAILDALPAAEVVSIAESSSSVSSTEAELNFEHLDKNFDKEAQEEPSERGKNNSNNKNDSKKFDEIKLTSLL